MARQFPLSLKDATTTHNLQQHIPRRERVALLDLPRVNAALGHGGGHSRHAETGDRRAHRAVVQRATRSEGAGRCAGGGTQAQA